LPWILRCTRVPKISAILSAVSRHRPNSQLRSEKLVDGEVALEIEITVILDLGDRVKA
jgi:hypothetical protein